MSRFLLATLLVFFTTGSLLAQQTIVLFQEDFNAGNNTFTLNSGGPAANAGSNQWIVNNEFNGNGIYPNTTPQDQTASGTIAQAPNSTYLHVHDANTAGTTNCNYDNAAVSDNFAYMTGGFCTVGLINVKFTFFYLAEGNATDFGQVYYSIDGGGTWVQCGNPQYNNTTLWTYQVITDPAFENQPDVRFGFRWSNTGAGGADKMSFGVDDIIAVGDYDTNNPVEISLTVTPNPVCEANNVFISYELSYPLCDGVYEIQLSDASGSFASASNAGVFNIGTGVTSGSVAIAMPSTSGDCYKIRINRVSPLPAISGEASICIEVIDCPNTITTLQPAVTLGPDTLCNESVIDVPFYSTGVFNNNNQYIAQLSNVDGTFPANPTLLGAIPDPGTYDPLLGSPPGSVSGLIPGVEPGCNYYIRVVSTSPAVTPPPANYFGPFCIRECDVTTNEMQDIKVCVTPTEGVDTTITLEIDSWGNGVTYGPGNEFLVQVLHSQFYTVLNTGSLGTVTAAANTSLTLSIPNLNDLVALLGAPGYGMYYLRLIPTNASSPSDTLGTLVRLIIGTINPPGVVTPNDSVLCPGSIVELYLDPFDWNSQYEWYSPSLSNGDPFFWSYNPLMVQFNANTNPQSFWFTVREVNSGFCYSPWADTVTVHVIGTPNVNIQSTSPVCVGDSVHFWVPFLTATYYDWTTSGGEIVKFANNEITVMFDSAGTYTIDVFALNECGSNDGTKTVTVLPRPEVVAGDDVFECVGTQVALSAIGTGGTAFAWWTLDSAQLSSTSALAVVADSSVSYVVSLTSPAGCKDYDTVLVAAFSSTGLTLDIQDITCNGLADGAVAVQGAQGTPPYSYHWNTGDTVPALTGLADGTYDVTITDANGCTAGTGGTITMPPPVSLLVFSTPTLYGMLDGAAWAQAVGGTAPHSYTWSTIPTEFDSLVTGLDVGTYTVTVVDAEGCTGSASVNVEYAENIIYIPNAFSPNGDGLNEFFDYYTVNLESIEMMIFNRWGENVYATTDPRARWTGRYNGALAPLGVYAYWIKAKFLDGETKFLEGNVTVIR